MTGVDAIAGAFLLHRAHASVSPWALELALVPFGLASILLLIVAVRRWPSEQRGDSEPQAANVSDP